MHYWQARSYMWAVIGRILWELSAIRIDTTVSYFKLFSVNNIFPCLRFRTWIRFVFRDICLWFPFPLYVQSRPAGWPRVSSDLSDVTAFLLGFLWLHRCVVLFRSFAPSLEIQVSGHRFTGFALCYLLVCHHRTGFPSLCTHSLAGAFYFRNDVCHLNKTNICHTWSVD